VITARTPARFKLNQYHDSLTAHNELFGYPLRHHFRIDDEAAAEIKDQLSRELPPNAVAHGGSVIAEAANETSRLDAYIFADESYDSDRSRNIRWPTVTDPRSGVIGTNYLDDRS